MRDHCWTSPPSAWARTKTFALALEITVERAREEARLAAERRIEAGRLDAQRRAQLRHAHCVIAAAVEQRQSAVSTPASISKARGLPRLPAEIVAITKILLAPAARPIFIAVTILTQGGRHDWFHGQEYPRPRRQPSIGAAIVRRFAGNGAVLALTYAGSVDAAKALSAETGASSAADSARSWRVRRRRSRLAARWM